MNKATITLKVDDYTIILHRGPEEPKEMEQKRMAMYATWIFNMSMKPMVKYFEKYYPELQPVVCSILKKAESKMLNGKNKIESF
jgi:hypothetical protein